MTLGKYHFILLPAGFYDDCKFFRRGNLHGHPQAEHILRHCLQRFICLFQRHIGQFYKP